MQKTCPELLLCQTPTDRTTKARRLLPPRSPSRNRSHQAHKRPVDGLWRHRADRELLLTEPDRRGRHHLSARGREQGRLSRRRQVSVARSTAAPVWRRCILVQVSVVNLSISISTCLCVVRLRELHGTEELESALSMMSFKRAPTPDSVLLAARLVGLDRPPVPASSLPFLPCCVFRHSDTNGPAPTSLLSVLGRPRQGQTGERRRPSLSR